MSSLASARSGIQPKGLEDSDIAVHAADFAASRIAEQEQHEDVRNPERRATNVG